MGTLTLASQAEIDVWVQAPMECVLGVAAGGRCPLSLRGSGGIALRKMLRLHLQNPAI